MNNRQKTTLLVVMLIFAITMLACDLGGIGKAAEPTPVPTQPPPPPPVMRTPRPLLPTQPPPVGRTPQPTLPPATSPPAPPSNLRAIQVTQTEIVITWQDKSDNEVGFRVYLGGTDVVARVGPNVTRAVLTNLTCNVQYQYTVRAVNAAGESAPSNAIDVTTAKCP